MRGTRCPYPKSRVSLPASEVSASSRRATVRAARIDISAIDSPSIVISTILDPNAGPQKLASEKVYPLTIDLGDIHHVFRVGSRIEIDVTSSNFPRRARNTNSGHPVLAHDGEADIRIATNTVYHAKATQSFMELPVLGR